MYPQQMFEQNMKGIFFSRVLTVPQLSHLQIFGFLMRWLTLRKLAHAQRFLEVKIEKFQLKKFDSFLIFAPKHRLWLQVRTASARLF